jgi:hypothetical protein
MKTIISPPSTSAVVGPDFSGRPKRYDLDQSFAVKDLGRLKLRPIRLDDEKDMIVFHRRAFTCAISNT